MHHDVALPLFALLTLAPGAGAQLVFENVALETGVDTMTFGRGAAMVDVDGDGRLDLIAGNDGMDNLFFRQKANGEFAPANADWGVPADTQPTWGVLAADFDNGGDVDVYFVNGGFAYPAPNQLLRNDLDGSGTFVDVSALGDAAGAEQTFGASAFDIDADGLLDILASDDFPGCKLLRNTGGLVFADVSAAYGVPTSIRNRHTGAGDYDNDGWIDVGIGSVNGNLLLHNEGGVGVTDLAEPAGVLSPFDNFGFVFHDFDNDGWLDVYLPKYQITPVKPSEFFLNQQDGTFEDVTAGSGMTGQDDMGHAVYDLDADGLGELYIGTGNPQYLAYDLLYKISPGATGGLEVVDLTESSGILAVGMTRNHGMACGDYDDDGDVDVYVNLGGPFWLPDSIEANALWRNAGNDNAWLRVGLRGVLSNRDAVGARASAFLASGREVHVQRAVGMGFTNTPEPTLHLGLGAETAVERLEVRWPSGIVQTVSAPAAFTGLELVETGLAGGILGDTVQIRAAGPAGDVVQLAFSPTPADVALPPLGTLALGPPIVLLPPLLLDAAGLAQLDVPIDPAVTAGHTLYVQAWIHPPLPELAGTLTNTVTLAFP